MSIFFNIENAIKHKQPFVSYRKPNTTLLKGLFQQNDEVFSSKNYTESGFIFAPFNNEEKAILLPLKESSYFEEEVNSTTTNFNNITTSPDTSAQQEHIKLVEKGIQAINNNEFKKVVLSRKEKVEVPEFNLLNSFQKLLNSYPTAFVYVWYHPKVGLWLGATPETLVNIKNQQFTTMSLAGTQVYKNTTNVVWQPKEIEEQQFVTDYIIDNITNVCSSITTSKTTTIKAGNLLHLRTLIKGELKSKNVADLINNLHPTPAVCGLPLQPSKGFILATENYHRNFYTGFLGELNINNESNLFVNLRCMEVCSTTINIFVGGGITKNSNALNEWQETVAKTTTMKKVL